MVNLVSVGNMDNLSFDPVRFRLGSLCKRGHGWNGTQQSLRKQGSYSCVECSKLKTKEWQANNREKCREAYRKWRASNPQQARDATHRWTTSDRGRAYRRNQSQQWREQNRQKHRDLVKIYNQTPKGKLQRRERLKRYFQTPKGAAVARECVKRRRALKQQARIEFFTETERLQRFILFDGCAYCGEIATVLDHFVALSAGGNHSLSNLIPACDRCNSYKWNFNPQAWYERQSFYDAERWQKIIDTLG